MGERARKYGRTEMYRASGKAVELRWESAESPPEIGGKCTLEMRWFTA